MSALPYLLSRIASGRRSGCGTRRLGRGGWGGTRCGMRCGARRGMRCGWRRPTSGRASRGRRRGGQRRGAATATAAWHG